MKNVLFVCTGNSCRSVMAEYAFRAIADQTRSGEFEVASAGTATMDGLPSSSDTVKVLRKRGIDASGHESTRLTPEIIDWADAIYVMEWLHYDWVLHLNPSAKSKVFMLAEFAGQRISDDSEIGIPDPINTSQDFYLSTLEYIESCVCGVLKTI